MYVLVVCLVVKGGGKMNTYGVGVPDEIISVAVYCRVSTEKEDQANSLESQVRYFKEYISRQPMWELYDVYVDEGISGTNTEKRVAFNRMLADAKLRKFNLIITKEISRFARNTMDTLAFTRELKSMGIGVIFANDNLCTLDADAELRLTIMASIAQEESRKTSERVKWGQKRRMEQGVVFGRDMLGYDVRDGKMYINEEGAEIVRRIFHKYVVEGKGSTTIARELREEGYHSPNKTGWTNVVILRALRNEKYCGDLVQKKTITPDYLSHKKVVNDGKEPFIIIHDHHEPIISKELFARAQKELEKRSLTQENRRKLGRRYCFSGKITCGECGRSYVFHNKKRNNGSRYHFWECYNKKIYGKTKRLHEEKDEIVGCDNIPISDKDLRTLVSTIISELEFDEENVLRKMKKQLIQAFSEGTKIEYDAEKKKLAIIKDRRKKLVDIYIDHVITKEEFKERCEILDKEISLMENKVRELEKFKTEKGLVENERDAIIKDCISYAKDTISCNVVADEFIEAILDEIIIYKNNTIIVKLNLIPDEWKIVVQLGKKMNKNPSEEAKRSVSATDVPTSVSKPLSSE